MTEKNEGTTPDVVDDFQKLLEEYELKPEKARVIAGYIADTGQPDVFDDPEALAEKLAKWPRDLHPVKRATLLEHWGAQRGLYIPKELLRRTEAPDVMRERTAAAERRLQEGRIWFVDKDVRGITDLRLAKKDELAMTMEEAKEAMKAMGGEEGGVVVYDEEKGRHVPNWSSPFVKRNPSVAWAAAHAQDKAMAEGQEQDPLDIMMAALARAEQVKAMMGGGTTAAAPQSTVGEIFEGIERLDTLRGGRTQGPEWMSDPMQFWQAIQLAVQQMTPKVDSTASEEVKELEKQLDTEREERRKAELARVADQNTALANRVRELEDEVNKPRAATGATAADRRARSPAHPTPRCE